MKAYVVSLCHSQHSTGELIIHARDKDHAEQLAEAITADQCSFDPQDGDLYVSVIAEADDADVAYYENAAAEEAARQRLQAHAEELLADCCALCAAVAGIIANWHKGDLAAAVNAAEQEMHEARLTIAKVEGLQ